MSHVNVDLSNTYTLMLVGREKMENTRQEDDSSAQTHWFGTAFCPLPNAVAETKPLVATAWHLACRNTGDLEAIRGCCQSQLSSALAHYVVALQLMHQALRPASASASGWDTRQHLTASGQPGSPMLRASSAGAVMAAPGRGAAHLNG